MQGQNGAQNENVSKHEGSKKITEKNGEEKLTKSNPEENNAQKIWSMERLENSRWQLEWWWGKQLDDKNLGARAFSL